MARREPSPLVLFGVARAVIHLGGVDGGFFGLMVFEMYLGISCCASERKRRWVAAVGGGGIWAEVRPGTAMRFDALVATIKRNPEGVGGSGEGSHTLEPNVSPCPSPLHLQTPCGRGHGRGPCAVAKGVRL